MKLHLCLIFLAIGGIFRGQDIDRILHSKPFSHNGTVGMDLIGAFNQYSQNPFTYVFSASYTPTVFGIALPFSMMYSNQKFAYGHPFNYWRFAPSYRWIRAQFGEVNVHFSPYSLAGHRFRGTAVDIQPNDCWTISALYGRLNDFRPSDSTGQNGSYQRMGYGVKIAYNKSKYSLSGSFFKAKDLENVMITNLAPQENVVIDVTGQWTFAPNLRISGTLASSALTRNTHDDRINADFKIRNMVGQCLPYRLSTAVFNAYKINFGAPFLSVGYEYVAPNYQTLGAYYSTHDFENITLNTSQKFKDFTIGGRFGVQRDDLKNQKQNRSKRFVYAANLAYGGTSRISGQLAYSSFQTVTRVEKFLSEFETTNPYAQTDTLNFRQIVQNGDLSLAVRLRETQTSQEQFQTQVSVQKTSENTMFIMSSINYVRSRKSGKNLGVSAYIQRENFAENDRMLLGLTLFFGRPFAERKGLWKVTFSENTESIDNHNFILKTSVSYTLCKKHRFQGQFSQRLGHSGFATMLNINYGYAF